MIEIVKNRVSFASSESPLIGNCPCCMDKICVLSGSVTAIGVVALVTLSKAMVSRSAQ